MTYRGNTDRRFNDWHYTLANDWWYIDLDGLEVCRRCREPLLIYEVTRDSTKATSILHRLATKAGIPAVLMLLPGDVALDDSTIIRWRWVVPVGAWHTESLGTWRERIAMVREHHDVERHAIVGVVA